MRTPQEYISDMREEVLDTIFPDLLDSSIAYNDQLHADIKRMAKTVGVSADSQGFKASVLLAGDLLDHLAACLEKTDEEDSEIGAFYIREATRRLRLLALWGETACPTDCLDLR